MFFSAPPTRHSKEKDVKFTTKRPQFKQHFNHMTCATQFTSDNQIYLTF